MSELADFDAPDRFTTGTIGPPGARVFYLQASQGTRTLSLRLEKQQVAALCDYLGGILADLPVSRPDHALPMDLAEPGEPAFVVGSLAVAYEQADDRVLLVAEELVELDEGGDPIRLPAVARFHLRRDQVQAFVEHGAAVVAAGRPPCQLCGQPLDPSGHQCPRLN